MLTDKRVKKMTVGEDNLIISNIWGENFNITFLNIPDLGIAAHAEMIV